MNNRGKFLFLVFVTCGMFLSTKVFGTHAQGMDITYSCIGPDTYAISVSFYRDCGGTGAPNDFELQYFSQSCNIGLSTPISVTVPQVSSMEILDHVPAGCGIVTSCSGGAFPGVQEYIYRDTITLPAQCSDWILGFTLCCRNNAITNLQSASTFDLFAYATINNENGICNNSPTFNNLPVTFTCQSNPFSFNNSLIDAEGDSLVFSLIQPLDAYQTPIAYSGTYELSHPMSTTSSDTFKFNPLTGDISFTPDIQQTGVITILVEEYRNGVLIGTTMRDIQIGVLQSNLCTQPPVLSLDSLQGGGFIDDSSTIQMCPNTQLVLRVIATDPDGNNVIMSSSASSAISGSSFFVNSLGSTALGTFVWTPTANDTGFHAFQVTYKDDGCPLTIPVTETYVIYVFNKVNITTGDTAVFCHQPIQLNVIGGSYFNWTPATDLSNPNIFNPIASPTIPTWYTATSDCGVDSVFVDVQPAFAIDAGRDTSVCLNSQARLNGFTDPAFAPYTYSWSPAAGLSQTNILTPNASPRYTTDYVLTATSSVGCILQDTVNIAISGVAPRVTAFAEPDTICYGATTQLSLTTSPEVCGLSTAPCLGLPNNYELGVGSSQLMEGSPYRGDWEDGRVQYLIRSSELHALDIQGGAITAIAFQIAQKKSTKPYSGFTIRMGCTSADALTNNNFIQGLPVVYGPRDFTSNIGWNKYTLDANYDWDGSSNLVIEICFDNSNFSDFDAVLGGPTGFASVSHDFADASTGCSIKNPELSSDRPNIRIDLCEQTIPGATINWSASTPSTQYIDPPTIANPKAKPYATTEFTVNVSDGGCVGNNFVTVVSDTTITLTAEPDTSLCVATPIQLRTKTTGTPAAVVLTCGTNGTAVTSTTKFGLGIAQAVTANPTPFKGTFHAGRVQMLFRASELTALGMTGGVVNRLDFNVPFKSSSMGFNDFTIKMGCTNSAQLTGNFESNLDIVYTPKTVSTNVGWNNFVFDNSFDWDGSSNVLVEVCFTNNSANNDDIISFTTTPFNSVLYDANDFAIGCALSNPAVSANRPDVRLHIAPPPAGSFDYTWSPNLYLDDYKIPNPIASPDTTIGYRVTVSDGTCFATDSLTITFYETFDVNVFGSNVGCNGASDGNAVSIPIGGVSPYDFIWNTGPGAIGAMTDTLYNLLAGKYKVTVTDNNGCLASDSVTLTVPPPLSDIINTNDVSCFGGSDGWALVIPSGGTLPHNYAWSNMQYSDLDSNLSAGKYYLTITDGSGCQIIDSTEITEPTALQITTTTGDVSCYKYTDGSAMVIANGGTAPYEYLWSGGVQNDSVTSDLPAGDYWIAVTDNNDCTIADTVTINEPDSLGIIISTIDVSCFNDSDGVANASVLGDTVNYSFLWNSSTSQSGPKATGLPAGNISVEVTDTAGCIISSMTTIGSPDEIKVTTSSDSVSCYGGSNGSAVITVVSGGTAPFTYKWSTNNQIDSMATGLMAGDIIGTVIDANNCESSEIITVPQPAPLSLITSVIDSISCFGGADGALYISYSGGISPYLVEWNDNQTTDTASHLAEGNYSVSVTDANGCIDSVTGLQINQPSPIVFDTIFSIPTCAGEESGIIQLSTSGGTGSHVYSINGGSFQPSPRITGLSDGIYDISVMDEKGCDNTIQYPVTTYDSVSVSFSQDEIKISLGEEIRLSPVIDPSSGSYDYLWKPGTGLSAIDSLNPVASPQQTTTYELTVTTADNCSFRATITVEVDNELIVEVPNVFTPNNGDFLNDELHVYGISIESVIFKVFNRWGEKIFETRDYNEGWDGTFKGKDQPPGVYIFYVDAVFNDGQKKSIKGSVTLIK